MQIIEPYPSITNTYHKSMADFFHDSRYILVEEKIDGSQFSFGMFDGVVQYRSKGRNIPLGQADANFKAACATVERLAPKLVEGWTYRAEVLSKPRHNVLTYSRVPEGNLIVFDIQNRDGSFLMWSDKHREAATLGLEVVPILEEFGPYKSGATNQEILATMMDRESVLGGCKIEGLVLKRYEHVMGSQQQVRFGKMVSAAFHEVKGVPHIKPGQSDPLGGIIASLCTEARWQKAVQHLRDDGRLFNTVKDIGPLVAEVAADIEKEQKDEILDLLWKWAQPKIRTGAVRGMAEWYKEGLDE